VLGAIIGSAILAYANEKIAYSSLRRRNASSLYFMISAMGTAIFLENLVYATIGSRFYAFPEVLTRQNLNVLGTSLGILDAFAIVFSSVAIYGLHWFLQNSKMGIAIRAASYDMQVSQINGVNINRLIGLVFLLAGALAGISGVFLGMKYMVYPTMGWITNKAYIAAVIGGLGSLPGAVVGGLLLGVLETFVSAYISSAIRDVFSFSLLVVLLLVLPSGLFGKYLEEKV
jgi:branched-chain amino acid transport system permease protein